MKTIFFTSLCTLFLSLTIVAQPPEGKTANANEYDQDHVAERSKKSHKEIDKVEMKNTKAQERANKQSEKNRKAKLQGNKKKEDKHQFNF
jgi:hypothetical protein